MIAQIITSVRTSELQPKEPRAGHGDVQGLQLHIILRVSLAVRAGAGRVAESFDLRLGVAKRRLLVHIDLPMRSSE
jgi:hypothetical protein